KERLFDFAAAVQDYRAALRAEPDNDEARARLAAVLLINGRPEEAVAEFERLRRRQGDTPEVLVGLARCRRKQGKLQEALGPGDRGLRCEAADLFFRLGEPREAVRWLRGVLQIDPHHAGAHRALARHYRDTGHPDLAAGHERRANPP